MNNNQLKNALKKWQSLGSRTKKIIICVAVLVGLLVIYSTVIAPRLKQLDIANQALDRAKSGYAFIIKNAPALKNTGNSDRTINLNVPVKDAVLQLSSELNIMGVNAYDKSDKRVVVVSIKNSLPYAKVAEFLTRLENGYGITIKEINLDKQGDGMVYVNRLNVVRLEDSGD